MRITLLSGVRCTPDKGTVIDIDAGTFLDRLGSRERVPSVEIADEAAKLEGDGFVLAQYRDGATSKRIDQLAPDSSTDVLCFDIDEQSADEVRAAFPKWQLVDAAVYSTWKHTPEQPRLRLLVRLSRAVPHSGDEFAQVYNAVAYLLRVKFDPVTKDRARFFFGPQHKPGANGTIERHRFHGEILDVDAVLEAVRDGRIPMPTAAAGRGGGADFDGLRRTPKTKELTALAKRFMSLRDDRLRRVGAALEAVVEGKPFAPRGSVHSTMVQLAFELVRAEPLLDGDGFAEQFLEPCWVQMWPDEDTAPALGDWRKCVSSAESKLAASKQERAAETSAFTRTPGAELTDDDLLAAQEVADALVNEHRGAYYVWDARKRCYIGPLKGTGLAAACRDALVGIPNFSYLNYRKNAPPTMKTGPKLVEEYGVALEAVHYWASPPDNAYDASEKAIHISAFHWNDFPARYHQSADELLRAMAGPQYRRLEAWLAKFRDLRQPLPALTLVGSKGVWKSRTGHTLPRYWGPRDAGNPCDAAQVLNRFSGPLLTNPVIHSDERLALSETGRPLPDAYRRSITEPVHAIERKGIDPVTLHSCTRHIITVNDLDRVFGGGEVDAASVEATVERFLVVQVDAAAVAAFEKRWKGTTELDALREGTPLLEHVRWLEENRQHEGTCRLWVETGTDPEVLLRARFADDTLTTCMLIAIHALLNETKTSHPGQLDRMPLVCDKRGQLRVSPKRIVDLWPDSKLVAGSGLRKPTSQRVGRMLTKAGFKVDPTERASDSRWGAWALQHERLREFMHAEGSHTWREIEVAVERVFGRKLRHK